MPYFTNTKQPDIDAVVSLWKHPSQELEARVEDSRVDIEENINDANSSDNDMVFESVPASVGFVDDIPDDLIFEEAPNDEDLSMVNISNSTIWLRTGQSCSFPLFILPWMANMPLGLSCHLDRSPLVCRYLRYITSLIRRQNGWAQSWDTTGPKVLS